MGRQSDSDAQCAQMAVWQVVRDFVSDRIEAEERQKCFCGNGERGLIAPRRPGPEKKPASEAVEPRWCAMITLSRTLMPRKIVVS